MILTDNDNVLQFSGEVTRYGDENIPYEKGVVFFGDKGFGLIGQNLYDVSLPNGVKPYKYCYTKEKGFYLNPNWQPPSPYPTVLPEVVELIKADYTGELISQGVI